MWKLLLLILFPFFVYGQTIILVNKENSTALWAEDKCNEIETELQANVFCQWANSYYLSPTPAKKLIEVYETTGSFNYIRIHSSLEQKNPKMELDWQLFTRQETLDIVSQSYTQEAVFLKSKEPLNKKLFPAPPSPIKALTTLTLENKSLIKFDISQTQRPQYSLLSEYKPRYIFSFNFELKFR